MRFIGFEREEEAEEWARNQIFSASEPEFFRAVSAVDDDGNFVCVVVLTNFTSRNVDINIAMTGTKLAPRCSLLMFNAVFEFLFNHLRVARVTALVRGKHQKSKKITEHFGFALEGVMRKAFEDDDLLIYGFLAEDYRSHPWRRG